MLNQIILGFLFLVGLICIQASSSAPKSTSLQKVLILDVDGTIYDDECEIESQIRGNYIPFAFEFFKVNATECRSLRHKYGSTVRGLAIQENTKKVFIDYYNKVYPSVDMSKLRKYNKGMSKLNTGYNVLGMEKALENLYKIKCPIVVASNSPVFHVKRVMTRLGLARLNVSAFVTPERRGGITKLEAEFWNPILEMYPTETNKVSLLDDNKGNCELVTKLGIQGLHITGQKTFDENLVKFLLDEGIDPSFSFDQNSYLTNKNILDEQSFCPSTLETLQTLLDDRVLRKIQASDLTSPHTVRVVDLGAGHLNLFSLVMERLLRSFRSATEAMLGITTIRKVHYVAYEINKDLHPVAVKRLLGLGFVEVNAGNSDQRTFTGDYEGIEVTLDLLAVDFMEVEAPQQLKTVFNQEEGRGIDLVVGACVADLHPPKAFSSQILEFADDGGGVVYLPITFDGRTELRVKSREKKTKNFSLFNWFGGRQGIVSPVIPQVPKLKSLTSIGTEEESKKVFDIYHRHLTGLSHHLDSKDLQSQLHSHGCKLFNLDSTSDWRICESTHPYMWQCMLHFLAQGTCFDLFDRYDLSDWFQRVRLFSRDHPEWELELIASNRDILAQLPEIECFLHTPPELAEEGTEDAQVSELGYMFGTLTTDELRVAPGFQYRISGSPVSSSSMEDSYSTSDHTAVDQITPIVTTSGIVMSEPGTEQESNTPYVDLSFVVELDSADVDDTVTSVSMDDIQGASEVLASIVPEEPYHQGSRELVVSPSFLRSRSLEFIGPRRLRVVEEDISVDLSLGFVRIRTECSLVSTGTELKVFRGDLLQSDEPLDTAFSSMQGQGMQFPVRYGYSLVGIVDAVGTGVDPRMLGKRVFSFSPHSSLVVARADEVMLVPEGVAAEDAVFLPSVETAVSLAMEGTPLPGERVAVVGQGLIGQLVTTALKIWAPLSSVTAVDVVNTRLAGVQQFVSNILTENGFSKEDASLSVFNPLKQRSNELDDGVNEGLMTRCMGDASAFDVCVEVSGSISGLQTAVDRTTAGGKVVVGSWFASVNEGKGMSSRGLQLGTRFHRSGIQLVASQVSTIPPGLSRRWTKGRRFELTWEVLRRVKPSQLLVQHSFAGSPGEPFVVPMNTQALTEAYETLDKGGGLTALLRYDL